MREKKYYILDLIIWLGKVGITLALIWFGGNWLLHKWNFPGLP